MFPLLSAALLAALSLPKGYAPVPDLDDFASCHSKFFPIGGCDAVRWNLAGSPPGTPPGGSSNGLYGGDDWPIQFVTLNPGRIYMAYSTLFDPTTGIRKNNVLMTVLELACGESADILVFGTGYGCRVIGTGESERGPEHDAQLIDDIVRGCMGLQGTLKVAFVVPHGHPDHINPEFIHALEEFGTYTVDKIYVHTDDQGALTAGGMNCSVTLQTCTCPPNCLSSPFSCWTVQTFGQGDCCNLGPFIQGPTCSAEPPQLDCETAWDQTLNFRSTLGRVWFRGRDGHTPGSVDLVLDHKAGTVEQPIRFMIWGSMIPGCLAKNCNDGEGQCSVAPACPALAGLQWAIPAHGNIPLVLPPASYQDLCPPCGQD